MSTGDALVRRWIDAFNGRDFAAYSAMGTDAYMEHAVAPFGRLAPGVVDGTRHLQETAEWLLAQFPDLWMRILAIVAEGDHVAVRVETDGTNRGPINGVVPPTGRHFSAEQSHWFRIEGGRLAEHWATRDDLGAMLQLGVLDLPGSPRP